MYLRLLVLACLFTQILLAQTAKLDNLKARAYLLTGREKVDLQNRIAWHFNFYFIRADSAMHYATLAYQASASINYSSGKALSLLTQGDVQGRLLGHLDVMERYTKQAITLLESTTDTANLSKAYYKLAVASISKGKRSFALEAARKAKQLSLAINDKPGLGWAIQATGLIYVQSGEYWRGFENLVESARLGREVNDSFLVSVSLAFIGRSFNQVGDPQKALAYYHHSLQYATSFLLLWPHLEDMANAHLQLKNYDSVLYYQQRHKHNLDSLISEPLVRAKFNTFNWGDRTEVQLARKQYNEILSTVMPDVQRLRKSGDAVPLMQALLTLGKVFKAKDETQRAFTFTRELLQLAMQTANQYFLREGNGLMASLFDAGKKPDSAYFYFKMYVAVKEAMDAGQFTQRTALYIAASEAENRLRLLQKNKEIGEQQLAINAKELARQGQIKNILIVGFISLFLFSVLLFRNVILKRRNDRLQNEKAQHALKQKTLELEMQALRAQMSPHFIFNCLSAIDNLIQTNQPDKATAYLARFASLIRAVLDSSKNNLVPFQKDFETLSLYLEMEQFRCNYKFMYTISADDELLQGDYKVPPLIVQPFVENAIHHGLLNKQQGDRHVEVTAYLDHEQIIYSVTDNGIGRQQAALLKQGNKPGQKSYGLAITQERVQLHNQSSRVNDVVITDLYHEQEIVGTKAEIKIYSR